MASEERRQAYLALIQALLDCEQGKEPEVLQANLEWVDAGLIAVMREVAAQLLAEGEENNGRWLNHWADNVEQVLASLTSGAGRGSTSDQTPSALRAPSLGKDGSNPVSGAGQALISPLSGGAGGGLDQEYAEFLQKLIQAVIQNEGNREQVYPLLLENLSLLDEQFIQFLKGWGEQTFQQIGTEEQRAFGALFYEVGRVFYGFNRGNPKVTTAITVLGYEFCAQTERQPGLERNLSSTLTNLGVAYRNQAELGINPAENLTQAIAAYQEAAEIQAQLGLEQDLLKAVKNLSIAGREMVQQGNWQLGLETLQDCLAQAPKLKDSQLYAEILYEIGRTHEMLSDWVNARLYYRDGLRQFTDLQNTSGQAKCHQGLGAVLASQGHREKGLAELKQAAELYQQLGDELGKVQVGQLISAASNGQPQPQKLLELTP